MNVYVYGCNVYVYLYMSVCVDVMFKSVYMGVCVYDMVKSMNMCECVCVSYVSVCRIWNIHVHTRIHMHTYPHLFTCRAHVCSLEHTRTYTCTCQRGVCMHMCTYVMACMHANINTYKQMSINNTCTCLVMCVHVCT